MLAFVSVVVGMPEPSRHDVCDMIFFWLLLSVFYHSLIAIFLMGNWKQFIERGPKWWQIFFQHRISIQPPSHRANSNRREASCEIISTCRIARYHRCQKRQKRRCNKGLGGGNGQWCPLQLAKDALAMPPPLPFRRRRKVAAETQHLEEPSKPQDIREGEFQDKGKDCNVDPNNSTPTDPSLHEHPSSQKSVVNTKSCEHENIPNSESRKKKKKKKKRALSSRYLPRPPLPAANRTSLIDLARMQRWKNLLDRLSLDQRDASTFAISEAAALQDADGLLPLHWACSGGPPVQVVESLLRVYPEGSLIVDGDGSSALHFACHYGGSVDVVRALMAANSGAIVIQDKYGRTPLYHAVDKSASMDVVRALVEANPLVITTPCIPQNAERAEKILSRDRRPLPQRTPLFLAWAVALSDRQTRVQRSGRLWEKAQFLLEAAYYYSYRKPTVYRMLHAAIALEDYLPKSTLVMALELYPEQVRQREENVHGRLPIGMVAAGFLSSSYERRAEVIQLLLDAFPEGARVADRDGRVPLVLALASGKTWDAGVFALFRAAPRVLLAREKTTNLFPALVSATARASYPPRRQKQQPSGGWGEGRQSETTTQEVDGVSVSAKAGVCFGSNRSVISGKDCNNHSALSKTSDAGLSYTNSSSNELHDGEEEKSLLTAEQESDLKHLSTIYELLKAEPSIIKSH